MVDGTVIASGLNLRDSLTTGGVVEVLRKSRRLEILGEETWYRVRTRDGEEGFVAAEFVEKDLAASPDSPADAADLSPVCKLERYEHGRFIGTPVTADLDFFPLLDRIAGFAEQQQLSLFITSSARDPKAKVRGAIVKPATRSNHMVGHAIDMNLKSDSGEFFNSKKLAKLAQQPANVQAFIAAVQQDSDLRWGGDFRARDVVHIDDRLNLNHPEIWDAKFASRR